MTLSRREFLWAGVPVAAGLGVVGTSAQGLEQFGSLAPPCIDDPRSTPQVPRDATYREGAPARTSLVETGMAGTRLALSGTVTGLTCGRIKDARIEIWHADAKGVYDAAGFRLRGHQLTNADGGYRFSTIVPGAPPRRARHIGVRIIVPAKADYATEIFFPDDPAAAKDPRFKKELVMRMVRATSGQAAVFDFVLPI
jgi:protocatechuate 3,4-dioxygenase beta subunit